MISLRNLSPYPGGMGWTIREPVHALPVNRRLPGDYGRDQRKGRVRAYEWSSISMAVSSSESSVVTN